MKSISTCLAMATIAGALSAGVDIDRLCPPRAETAAKYEAGTYPAAVRPYRDAAIAVYRYMTSLPAMTALVETGKPSQKYQHNAYVSKTHAAHIEAMLEWARADPSQREKALRFAKASAEYLLGELEPADAPLAWWPPTYGRKPLEFDPKTDGPYKEPTMIGNEQEGAVKYRGEVMLVYPSDVGLAFLEYYKATRDARFLSAARGIAETYLRTRRPDGSWPLKMKLSTGEVVGENTLVPDRTMLFFEALYAATCDARWRQAEESAFAWLETHPLSDWNWDGQFEDIRPAKPYQNPTKHNAIETMMYILRCFPGDKARLATCRMLLEFCEKRFVVWKAPSNHPDWPSPSVLEQYSCFTPIDSSVSKMIRGYLAMYRAEGRAEDCDKAKALGNMLTRIQKPSGRIPTFWEGVNTGDSGLSNERYDWLNCMASSARALVELAELDAVDPAASGRQNRIALQAMLDRGGIVRVDRPGRYRISGTLFIGSNTTLACAPGVVFVKADEEGKFSHVICNKGARTKTYDENIEIRGLEVAVNGVDVCDSSVAYGLRGQLAFFYAKNVKVKDFKCLDLGRGQFGLHFCTFENVVVEDCDIRGWKDGVHFGRGRGFRVSRCTFDTGDDPIALNAHDYATSNPELGWISEGVVEDCHDLRNNEKTVGYFCRILAGSWGEWKPGMPVRQSDSVIRPSGVYRVSMQPDGRTFTSAVVPESKPGKPNADGIVWRKVQDDPVTSCGVSNIVFRNLRLDQPRPLFSFHVDDDRYSRSCYPGTSVPSQTGIRFENVKVGFTEPKKAFLCKAPVAGLEFVDCDFGNCTGVPAGAAGWIDFNKNGVKDVYEDPAQPVERRVADLLSQMTVEEKTCQLATLYGSGRVLKDVAPTPRWKNEVWKDGIANIDEELNGVGRCYKTNQDLIYPFSNHVKAVEKIQRWFVEKTRLGIPVDFSNEGIHGLNHTKATPLPAPIGIGSTWNRALVREAGEIVGEEARLIGYSNVYAPILDVARDPRWGRTLECYGEDPFLVGALGAEMVRGIQSKGVASTLKHFAAYSVPKGGRDGMCRTDPHITPRELHEIFLCPFRHVIRETHPLGVMCSYNDWNGEPVAASRYFLTDLLRGEYGFDGFVVSDSEAVEFLQTKHQVAETYADACRMTLEAGMNVRTHFTPPEDFIRPVREQIESGRLPMSVIDRRVAEVLSVKFRLGLFDRPYLGDAENADRLAGMERHLEFVDRMQAEAMVLMKNDGLLPLSADRVKRVLVAGPLADETNFMSSRYGPNGHDCISVLRGLRDYLKGRAEVVYEKGCEVVDANWPDSEIVPTTLTSAEEATMRKATDAAADCDIIVAVLGEDDLRTGESRSRTSLDLPGRQQMLLERLQATGKPVVLVLVNGQPLTINWADRHVAAILETWFPHCRGGIVIAKTLFGEVNPSGRLTVTFPKSIGQIECNFPFKKGSHGRQNESGPNGSGKTRVVGALYPFGYGLSYTKFEYSNLVVTPKSGLATTEWAVTCEIRNAGTRHGAEVVQLYIRDRCSSVVTYDSVLRGFERVDLAPGESKRVTFSVCSEDLRILDREMKWTVEPGEFEIRVGASCEDIRLMKTIVLAGMKKQR